MFKKLHAAVLCIIFSVSFFQNVFAQKFEQGSGVVSEESIEKGLQTEQEEAPKSQYITSDVLTTKDVEPRLIFISAVI